MIDVQGKPWALVRIGSGFAAVAYQFRPHRDGEFPSTGGKIPRHRPVPLNFELAQQTFDAIKAALDVPEFTDSTTEELRHSYALIEHAWNKSKALIAHLHRCHNNEPNPERRARLSKQLDLVRKAKKQVRYQRRDALHFCRHYLGERP